MPEQIEIPVEAIECEAQIIKLSTKKDLGGKAINNAEVFQIPVTRVTSEEGTDGELVLRAERTGEKLFHGNAKQTDFDLAA